MFIPVVIWRSLPSINHGKIAGSSSHKSFGQLTPESAKRFIREAVDPQGQKVFQCTLCRMSTKHHFSMQRHMVIKHTRPSSHLCQYCQASFPNKFYLIKHISDRICMKDVMFDPWKWINIYKTFLLIIIFKNIRYFWFGVFDFLIILWFLFCFVCILFSFPFSFLWIFRSRGFRFTFCPDKGRRIDLSMRIVRLFTQLIQQIHWICQKSSYYAHSQRPLGVH